MNNEQCSKLHHVKDRSQSRSVCGDLVAAHHRRLAAAKLPAFQLTANKKNKKNVNSPRINSFCLVYLIILL